MKTKLPVRKEDSSWEMLLSKKLESANKYNNWHWATRKKDKDAWQWFLKSNNICNGFRAHVQNNKAKVRLTIISERKRLCDTDNLYGGNLKGLLDALKREQFIYDDSPEYLELKVEQIISKEEKTLLYFNLAHDIKDVEEAGI